MRYTSSTRSAGVAWVLMAALVALFLLLLTPRHAGGQQTQEIVVGPGEQHTSITEALAAAEDGDRIRIRAGTYREGPIRVEKSVALIGDGYPELDGEGKHPVLVVTADDVEIRGLVIRDVGTSHVRDNAGIRIEEASGCVIEGNRLENTFFGIYLARAKGCRVANNELRASATRESAAGNGIHLWNSSDVLIEKNEIRGHRDGIYLEFASGSTLRGNISENNLRYGLHFMYSNNTVYTGNVFRHNGAGVAVMFSRQVTIRDNLFEHNWGSAAYGLLLKEMTDSEITGNTFRRNTVGIYAEGTHRVEVTRNQFLNNGWAVRMRSNTRQNRFTTNNFIDNAFDVTTDTRQNSNTFVENYWSRYDGYDLTGDGFGDVPFRPVRLFGLIVERTPAAMVLLRTLFVDMLDLAERVFPVLTPETLIDERPLIREVRL